MNNKLTDVTILLDRSGSMASIKDDTIGGYNAFIKKQREAETDVHVTLVQFDHEYQVVYTDRPAKQVPDLEFAPRGTTALIDAFCNAIDSTGSRLRNLPESERPGLVVFCAITDGHENASTRHTRDQLFDRIRRQREQYQWQFVYLGANQDAIVEAQKYGISGIYTINYALQNTGKVFDSLSSNLCSTAAAVGRGMSVNSASANLAWSDKDREEAVKQR